MNSPAATRVRRPPKFLARSIVACLLAWPIAASAAEPADSLHAAVAATPRKSFLPLLGEEATKRGIELPLPFGAGLVYYHLDRQIEVSDLRLGINGAPPQSVSQLAKLGSTSVVDNYNLKLDAWILPFLNVYAIAGYVSNHSDTHVSVTLPPVLPGGPTRARTLTVPTDIKGSVGGLGMTLAHSRSGRVPALPFQPPRTDVITALNLSSNPIFACAKSASYVMK